MNYSPVKLILKSKPKNVNRASQIALVVKNSPVNARDIGDLSSIQGQEDPLEE